MGPSGSDNQSIESRPVRWMSTEALQDGIFSEKSDVWAFGITAFELLSRGATPYHALDDDSMIVHHVCEEDGRPVRPIDITIPCATEAYDAVWTLVGSCWENNTSTRPTFANLSVALGHTPTPTVLSLPSGRAVYKDMSNGDSSQLFVYKRTGELVTMAWLFEHGYSRADCISVADVAVQTRQTLQGHVDSTVAMVAATNAVISDVQRTKVTLKDSHASARTQIMGAFKDAQAHIIDTLQRRRHQLLAQLDSDVKERVGLLEAQLSELNAVEGMQSSAHTLIQNAIGKGDVDVLTCQHDVTRVVDALPDPPSANISASPRVLFSHSSPALHRSIADCVSAFGRLEVDPPHFYGYTDPNATYVCGAAVSCTNEPVFEGEDVVFTMEPDVPEGLLLDPTTGVISGTPEWPADVATEAHVATLQRTVEVTNASGCARTTITITLHHPTPEASLETPP